MKISGLLLLFMLLLGFCACEDDDKEFIPAGEASGQTVAFEKDTIFAYKGNGILQIPMQLSQTAGSTIEITVTARTIQGTIQEGTDYKLLSNTVVFEKGKNSAALEVEIPSDVKSGAAAFEIKISEIKGLGVSRDIQKSTCRVILMDSPFVAFEKAGYSIPENNETAFLIPVTLTGKIDQAVTVQFKVKEDATAIDPDNYTLNTRTLTFAPNGPQTQNLEISVVHNPEVNPDLALELEIISVSGSNAIVSPYSNTCRILITNVEAELKFNKPEVTATEGETITDLQLICGTIMSDDTEFEVSFWDDAETPSAYVNPTTVKVTVLKGQRSVIIPITAVDENKVNNTRQVMIHVSQNGLISNNTSTLKIQNNDVPTFELARYEVEEATGNYAVKLVIPEEAEEDIPIGISALGYNMEWGKEATLGASPVIAKGTKEAYFNVTIGFGRDIQFKNPHFALGVSKIFGAEAPQTDHQTEVYLTESSYRQMFGSWKISGAAMDGSGNTTEFIQEISAGSTEEEMITNWKNKNKYVVTNWQQSGLKWELEFIDGEYYIGSAPLDATNKIAYWNGSKYADIIPQAVKLTSVSPTQLSYSGYLAYNSYNADGTLKAIYNGIENPTWTKQ